MNLRDQKAYRDRYYKGYLRAFCESHIAKQSPETQARMRAHNEKVKLARALAKAQREATKRRREKDHEALATQRQATSADRSARQEAA